MQYVFGGLLITAGAMLVGLAFHDKIADAWSTLSS